jgi:hypothetical protein
MTRLAAAALALVLTAPAAAHARTPTHAADVAGLPKELWGKWCATATTTGGGSPRFWEYTRSTRSCPSDREDSRLASEDMTLGARSHNGCRAIASFEWKEENEPVYFLTYRCKNGDQYTAKYTPDRNDENHRTVQYSVAR